MRFKKLTALVVAAVLGTTTLVGCGLNKNATIATMGEVEVKAGTVEFMTKLSQYYYDDYYTLYYGDDYWTSTTSSSTTATNYDSLKDSIFQSVHAYYSLEQHMSDYGVTITDEDKTMIKTQAKSFLDSNSKEVLKALGADQEIVEEYLRLVLIYQRMHDAIVAEADTNVSDEEANMRGYSLIALHIADYYDSSYQLVSVSEEDVENQKGLAENLLKLMADGKTIDEAAEALEVTVSTGTYASDNSSLETALKEALDGLKEGESTTEAITTEKYIYIATLTAETDEKATQSNKETIISNRKSDHFDEVLEGYQKDDGWTINEKVAAKIEFTCHFTVTDPNAVSTETETTSETESETETETTTETETETQSTEK